MPVQSEQREVHAGSPVPGVCLLGDSKSSEVIMNSNITVGNHSLLSLPPSLPATHCPLPILPVY